MQWHGKSFMAWLYHKPNPNLPSLPFSEEFPLNLVFKCCLAENASMVLNKFQQLAIYSHQGKPYRILQGIYTSEEYVSGSIVTIFLVLWHMDKKQATLFLHRYFSLPGPAHWVKHTITKHLPWQTCQNCSILFWSWIRATSYCQYQFCNLKFIVSIWASILHRMNNKWLPKQSKST